MNSLSSLLEKPWLPLPASEKIEAGDDEGNLAAATALRFLIAIISVIFFLLILTFISRTQFSDFQAMAGTPWQPLTNTLPLWLNTSALLTASIALHFAGKQAKARKMAGSVIFIAVAVMFSLLFIIGQLWLWDRLIDLGYFVASNPANSYFYLFTGAHGLHLVGGIFALANVCLHFYRHHSPEKLSVNIGLCARYWHFLLGLWFVLFGLLTAGPESYKAIAQLCGL